MSGKLPDLAPNTVRDSGQPESVLVEQFLVSYNHRLVSYPLSDTKGRNDGSGTESRLERFVNDMTVDFMEHEIRSVRSEDASIPVTTNLMPSSEDPEIEAGVDAWKFRKRIDIVSWDSYPDGICRISGL